MPGKISKSSPSTIGNKYPTYRDNSFKTCNSWLDGKRLDDNAEGLWRVHDKLYDLTNFVARHPGGPEWLQLTEGTDITEQFETHHLTNKAEKYLSTFYVREASKPRNYLFTYKENGFYRTLKRRVAATLDGLDQTPITISKITTDLLLASVFLFAILSAKFNNFYFATVSSFCLSWNTVAAHNFLHQKNNFRMYYFNMSLQSFREWRILHAMSHHLYPNSIYDLEISFYEPHFKWIPQDKQAIQILWGWIFSPIIYSMINISSFFLRVIGTVNGQRTFYFSDLIPLLLPTAMYIFGSTNLTAVITTWIFSIITGSFFFGLISVNAGHHHPEITHEGDEVSEDLDFGIFQLNAVIDRKDAKQNQFMVLTHFGEHTLHHLFPTLDHGLLPQLNDIFLDTCKEFSVEMREYPWFELIKGQFQQLARTKTLTLRQRKFLQKNKL